jgi:hypothetical protein
VFEGLTAAAAVLAATISLVNLLVTTAISGRRAETRWARDSLTEAFVAFLDASWRNTDAARQRLRLIQEGAADSTAGEPELAAYDDMRSQLTRLRLLASPSVRDAGQELLRRHHEQGEAKAGAMKAAMSNTRASRLDFIETARRHLRIP